jgi:hypothetical protein
MIEEKKEKSLIILGIIAVIAIILLVMLFKQAMVGNVFYDDQLLVVTEEEKRPPETPIQPTDATQPYPFDERRFHWVESNRAYTITPSVEPIRKEVVTSWKQNK